MKIIAAWTVTGLICLTSFITGTTMWIDTIPAIGPDAAQVTKLAQPDISNIRANWPTESQPYSDQQLAVALDDLCRVKPGSYWDATAYGEALIRSVKGNGIEGYTLQHALIGQSNSRGSYCSRI